MKVPVISLDPPWSFEVWSADTGSGRSAESYYRTMTWADLAALGPAIDAIAADDCALFMWACRPSIPEALAMVAAWNEGQPKKRQWKYKTEAFTWVKTTKSGKPAMGMGYWTRANTEPVLLFTRGKVQRQDKGVPQVIMAPRMKHSAKPEEAQDRIERLVAGPYVELFARRQRPGWTCMGNEIDGLDICEALAQFAAKRATESILPPIRTTPLQRPAPRQAAIKMAL
jgi:N6-adenosine-specific RNA methylase IME4